MRCLVPAPRRRDARHRRRVGLRQDDTRAHDPPASSGDLGLRPFRGRRADDEERRGAPAPAPRAAGRLPGSVRVARPADAGGRDRRRAAADPRSLGSPERPAARRRALPPGRPEPGPLEPLPPRAVGRAAPARRHRARTRAVAEDARPRRAGLGARRLDPGRRRQPARRASSTTFGSRSSSSHTTCR